MISYVPVVNRSPEDVMSDTELPCSEEEEEETDDEEESSEEGEEAESSPSKNIPGEHCTKMHHVPSGRAGGVRSPSGLKKALPAPVAHSMKHRLAEKEPKHIATKPRKAALPKIKVVVPVASM